jgi:hypothetical protein
MLAGGFGARELRANSVGVLGLEDGPKQPQPRIKTYNPLRRAARSRAGHHQFGQFDTVSQALQPLSPPLFRQRARPS